MRRMRMRRWKTAEKISVQRGRPGSQYNTQYTSGGDVLGGVGVDAGGGYRCMGVYREWWTVAGGLNRGRGR
jgi:hypothetical protein